MFELVWDLSAFFQSSTVLWSAWFRCSLNSILRSAKGSSWRRFFDKKFAEYIALYVDRRDKWIWKLLQALHTYTSFTFVAPYECLTRAISRLCSPRPSTMVSEGATWSNFGLLTRRLESAGSELQKFWASCTISAAKKKGFQIILMVEYHLRGYNYIWFAWSRDQVVSFFVLVSFYGRKWIRYFRVFTSLCDSVKKSHFFTINQQQQLHKSRVPILKESFVGQNLCLGNA